RDLPRVRRGGRRGGPKLREQRRERGGDVALRGLDGSGVGAFADPLLERGVTARERVGHLLDRPTLLLDELPEQLVVERAIAADAREAVRDVEAVAVGEPVEGGAA